MVAVKETGPASAQNGCSPDGKEGSTSPEEQKQTALACLATGKRHLLVSDIPLAVNSLGEACQLMSAVFSETAAEMADVYFYYGKALLEMARLESAVLGNAVDMDAEESNGEEDEESDNEEDQKNNTEAEKPKSAEKEDVDGEEKDDEAEGDPDNLELAWEMLELAKVVYAKTAETKKDAELERQICETYMVLGEISLENENYPQAVEDLTICLKKQTDDLPSDSRCIAETHYQLSIAQSFDMKFEEAVASLEAAIKVLETRVSNLTDKKEPMEENVREKEIAEVESLIPEIKEKITDTKEMKTEALRKMKEAVGFALSSGSDLASASSGEKPVSSIPIKRKEAEPKKE